ncbi:MAG: hypothetical protein EOP07_00290 [Proteobacteria bacterium]|nr:MAG: hypothetical protein EOP07_00290 [Pseudomonadota bacterium]
MAISVFLVGLQAVFKNVAMSSKSQQKLSQAIDQVNSDRFVNQMISDDQLCAMSDFMEGIKGWEVSKVASDITLKDNGKFVDYGKITNSDLRTWPRSAGKEWRSHTFPDGRTISGEATINSVVFIQSRKREVLKTKAFGQEFIRVPVDVREKGVLAGESVVFEGGVPAFIELEPGNPGKAVACYRDVSSRSLCLDAGGKFDPLAPSDKQKCKMP